MDVQTQTITLNENPVLIAIIGGKSFAGVESICKALGLEEDRETAYLQGFLPSGLSEVNIDEKTVLFISEEKLPLWLMASFSAIEEVAGKINTFGNRINQLVMNEFFKTTEKPETTHARATYQNELNKVSPVLTRKKAELEALNKQLTSFKKKAAPKDTTTAQYSKYIEDKSRLINQQQKLKKEVETAQNQYDNMVKMLKHTGPAPTMVSNILHNIFS